MFWKTPRKIPAVKKTLLKINFTTSIFKILSNVWILWILGYYQVQKTSYNLAREVLVVMRYHIFIKSAL